MKEPRTPRLSLDLLRGFRAAATHMSFTRAAQELFITQSAVSHEVKALEQQLGTPLFSRVGRALQLTDAGRELLGAVDEALSIVDAAAERINGAAPTFSVTTSVPLASLWLGPRLVRFTRLFPALNMRLLATNDALELDREQLDIAIRYLRRGSETSSAEKLCDVEFFPVCSPTLARNRARPIRTPADLSQHVLLDLETAANGRPWYDWKVWFDARGGRPARSTRSLRFSHYDHVVDAAIAGNGIAIGKRPHLAKQLTEGSLVAPFGEAEIVVAGSYYVVVASRAPPDLARSFVGWLHGELERDARSARRATAGAARRSASGARTARG